MKSLLFLFSISFFSITCLAQVSISEISEGTMELPSQSVSALQTQLKFSTNLVEKSFWKFCQGFSKTTNFRTHYEVSIPTTVERIYVLGQLESLGSESTLFKLALKEEGQRTRYRAQLEDMLRQFTIQVHLDQYQMEIDLLEARAASVAEKNTKHIKDVGEGAKEHLFTLRNIQSKINEIRQKQQEVLNWD